MFKDEAYQQLAIKCGESVWERGLLKKGYGLCHGTCGNAFMLMALYKATGDKLWLNRAQRFLIWTGDSDVKSIVDNFENSGMQV